MDPKDLQAALQNHIAKLQNSGFVVTKMGKDKDGADLPMEQIKFDKEKGFLFEKINCLQASKYNLGDCNCEDHASEVIVDISPQEVFSRLRKIERQRHWESLPSDEKGEKAKREMFALQRMSAALTLTPDKANLPKREKKDKS